MCVCVCVCVFVCECVWMFVCVCFSRRRKSRHKPIETWTNSQSLANTQTHTFKNTRVHTRVTIEITRVHTHIWIDTHTWIYAHRTDKNVITFGNASLQSFHGLNSELMSIIKSKQTISQHHSLLTFLADWEGLKSGKCLPSLCMVYKRRSLIMSLSWNVYGSHIHDSFNLSNSNSDSWYLFCMATVTPMLDSGKDLDRSWQTILFWDTWKNVEFKPNIVWSFDAKEMTFLI